MMRSSSKTKPVKPSRSTVVRPLSSKPAASRRGQAKPARKFRTVAEAARTVSSAIKTSTSPSTQSKPTSIGINTVNEQIKRQAEQFMNAAKDARIPEQFQAMAEEGVNKSREAFDKISAAAKDQAKVAEDLMLASQAGARAIGAKIVDNTVNNTTAAFEAAQAIARAKTIPDATRLQAEFFQKQFALVGTQTQELFELSTRVAKQSFETVSSVATKSFEQVKKGR